MKEDGIEEISFPHPIFRELLEPTHGSIMTISQVREIVSTYAGYDSLADFVEEMDWGPDNTKEDFVLNLVNWYNIDADTANSILADCLLVIENARQAEVDMR